MPTSTATVTVAYYSWSSTCYHRHPDCYGLRHAKHIFKVEDRQPILRGCQYCNPGKELNRDDCDFSVEQYGNNMTLREPEQATPSFLAHLDDLEQQSSPRTVQTVRWSNSYATNTNTASNDFIISPSPPAQHSTYPLSFDSDHITTTPMRPMNFDCGSTTLNSVIAMTEPSSVSTIGLETPSFMASARGVSTKYASSYATNKGVKNYNTSVSSKHTSISTATNKFAGGNGGNNYSISSKYTSISTNKGVKNFNINASTSSWSKSESTKNHQLYSINSSLPTTQNTIKLNHLQSIQPPPPSTLASSTLSSTTTSTTTTTRNKRMSEVSNPSPGQTTMRGVRQRKKQEEEKSKNLEAKCHRNLDAYHNVFHRTTHIKSPPDATPRDFKNNKNNKSNLNLHHRDNTFLGELEPMETGPVPTPVANSSSTTAENEKKTTSTTTATAYDKLFLASSIPLNTVRRVSELSLLDRPPPQLKKNLRIGLPRNLPPAHLNASLFNGDDRSGLSFPSAPTFESKEREPVAKAAVRRHLPEPRNATRQRHSPTDLCRESLNSDTRPPLPKARPPSTEAAKLILMSGTTTTTTTTTTTEPLAKASDISSLSFAVDSSDPPMPPRPKSFMRVDTMSDASSVRPKSLKHRLFGSCLGYERTRPDRKAYV